MKTLIYKKEFRRCITLIFSIATSLAVLKGQVQQRNFIKGQLKDSQSMEAVAYATVALRRLSDSTLVTGTASNQDGEFIMESVADGKYSLIISAIGYGPASKNIDLTENINAGTILLEQKSLTLGEVMVVGDRIKAKAGQDKTTYFINKKMYDASDNGVDILGYIPGVQVDLMKNISLQGSQHIVILVDGRERDRKFLSQLDANQIDQVEIIDKPGSGYDADVTGVISIILKKEKESGINGQIHVELPTSESVIYVFPDYSINYRFRRLNLYTSYNGELSYFNINESSNRNFSASTGSTEIMTYQILRQKDWSHRFNYGFDYSFNKKNQINFYAFYNPYSNELNGNVEMQVTGKNIDDQRWSALKRDNDINRSVFYSIYYKHIFNREAREITFDLSYFNFRADNTTNYITSNSSSVNFLTDQANTVKPLQNSVSLKIDYTSPITQKLKYDAGIKFKSQLLQDRQSDQFNYNESIYALYGSLTWTLSKLTLGTGIRAENSSEALSDSFDKNDFALLPNVSMNYKITPKQNLKLSYSRTAYRPNIYDLNPYVSVDDPFAIRSGNPYLKPEFRQNLSLDYSNNIGNNYLSFQMFYYKRADAVNRYTFINESNIFETRIANLGDIHEYGIQITGALKPHKAIAVNPWLRLFGISTSGNDLAKQYGIENRDRVAFESGLSAIVTFRYDITASLQIQYNSPEIELQNMSFSDALYFISLEKNFNRKFKIGITSALPFSKRFTYQGNEIKGSNFYSHSEGNVLLSSFPVWFKFTYQFNSGKKSDRIDRVREETEKMPKKGF